MNEAIGKKVKSGMIWTFLERIGTKIIQFILQLILARLLLPEDFGLCALLLAFTNIATVFVNSGLNTALIQKKDADQIDFSSVLYVSLGISIILYLLLYVFAPYIASFFNDSRLISLIRVLAITLIIGAFNSVQMTVLSRNMQFRKLFVANIIGITISAIISIYFALNGLGVWAIVLQYLTNRIIVTFVLLIQIKWFPKLSFSISRIKQLFSFGWKCMATTFISTIVTDIYTAVIGKFYTKTQLGIYDTGNKIPSTISETFTSSLGNVLFPAFSQLQNDIPKLKDYIIKSNKISSFLIMPIMFGLAAIAHPLIEILLTPKWIDSAPFLQIACILYAFYPLHIANIQAINAIGKSDIALKCEIQKKIVDLTFLVLLIHISIYWVAFGRMLTSIISLWINMKPNEKILNYTFKSQIKDILPTLLIALTTGIIIYAIPSLIKLNIIFLLITQVTFGIIIYFCISFIFNKELMITVIQTIKPKQKIWPSQK